MKVIIILTIEIPEKLILDSHPVQLQNLPKAKDFFSQKLKVYILSFRYIQHTPPRILAEAGQDLDVCPCYDIVNHLSNIL